MIISQFVTGIFKGYAYKNIYCVFLCFYTCKNANDTVGLGRKIQLPDLKKYISMLRE